MTAATLAAPHPLARMFSYCVGGQMEPSSLSAVCDLLEEVPASADERAALAHFYLDLLEEGDGMGALPPASEIADVLSIVRA